MIGFTSSSKVITLSSDECQPPTCSLSKRKFTVLSNAVLPLKPVHGDVWGFAHDVLPNFSRSCLFVVTARKSRLLFFYSANNVALFFQFVVTTGESHLLAEGEAEDDSRRANESGGTAATFTHDPFQVKL